jgi:trehalose/maltose hydrolase-like predicted phosphorylase
MLITTQRENLDRFWDRADVRVQTRLNPVRHQQAIRWNLYQVAQASWRPEGAGVPAKGVWKELAFALRFCDRQIRVQLTHAKERYLVDEGAPLKVTIRGEPHLLSPGTPAVIRHSPP